jgi:selenide, water dikinase
VFYDRVPFLPKVMDYIVAGAIPGGTLNNLDYIKDIVHFENGISRSVKLLLSDAQTSGGLLVSLPYGQVRKFLHDLHQEGITEAAIIGKINKGPAAISVHLNAKRNL